MAGLLGSLALMKPVFLVNDVLWKRLCPHELLVRLPQEQQIQRLGVEQPQPVIGPSPYLVPGQLLQTHPGYEAVLQI